MIWEIDSFDCAGPVEAAEKALEVQRRVSDATVFCVIDEHGNRFRVDLADAEPGAVKEG